MTKEYKRTDRPCTICGELVLNVDPKSKGVYCWKCIANGKYITYKLTGTARSLTDLGLSALRLNKTRVTTNLKTTPSPKRPNTKRRDRYGKRKGDYIREYLDEGLEVPDIVLKILEKFPQEDEVLLRRYICMYRSKLKKARMNTENKS